MDNLYTNNPSELGQTRLKPHIVVTREWYDSLIGLFAGLRLLANGMYFYNGEMVPRDVHLRALLQGYDFLDEKVMEPLEERWILEKG